MLSRELIRSNPDLVKEAVRIRCDIAPIDEIVELDADQRKLKVESETLKAKRNRISKSFGDKGLSEEQREELRAHAADLRDRVAELDRRTDELETRLHELELWVPNIPDPSVPLGTTEEDNVVIRSWGEPRHFSFQPQSHADLGESLGIFDSEDAVRMSGTRFYSLRGLGARLEHALGRFMLDIQVREHGFRETWIPYAVKSEAMIVSAQLPKFAEEAYYLQSEDLYLIPTGD